MTFPDRSRSTCIYRKPNRSPTRQRLTVLLGLENGQTAGADRRQIQALIPATGGIFTVHLTYRAHTNDGGTDDVVLWDRKVEGGFPEAKILKQRLRNHIEPDKKLGHSDTPSSKSTPSETAQKSSAKVKPDESNITAERSALDAPAVPSKVADCEDCT